MASLTLTLDDASARARYCVSGTDIFVMGHYPGNPIFPGVLILDMLIELGEALGARRFGSASITRVVRVQYLKASLPGDVLELEVSVKAEADQVLTLVATASRGGAVCTRATFACSALTLPESAHA